MVLFSLPGPEIVRTAAITTAHGVEHFVVSRVGEVAARIEKARGA
jgi:hypothetical protein